MTFKEHKKTDAIICKWNYSNVSLSGRLLTRLNEKREKQSSWTDYQVWMRLFLLHSWSIDVIKTKQRKCIWFIRECRTKERKTSTEECQGWWNIEIIEWILLLVLVNLPHRKKFMNVQMWQKLDKVVFRSWHRNNEGNQNNKNFLLKTVNRVIGIKRIKWAGCQTNEEKDVIK